MASFQAAIQACSAVARIRWPIRTMQRWSTARRRLSSAMLSSQPLSAVDSVWLRSLATMFPTTFRWRFRSPTAWRQASIAEATCAWENRLIVPTSRPISRLSRSALFSILTFIVDVAVASSSNFCCFSSIFCWSTSGCLSCSPSCWKSWFSSHAVSPSPRSTPPRFCSWPAISSGAELEPAAGTAVLERGVASLLGQPPFAGGGVCPGAPPASRGGVPSGSTGPGAVGDPP